MREESNVSLTTSMKCFRRAKLKSSAVVGVLGVTERLATEAEEENTSLFFAQLFDRQLARQRAALDAFAVSWLSCLFDEAHKLMGRMIKYVQLRIAEIPYVNDAGLPSSCDTFR